MDGQPRPVTTGTSCQADPEHRRYAGARPVRAGAGVGCPLFGSFLWASRERNPHRAECSNQSSEHHRCGILSVVGHSSTPKTAPQCQGFRALQQTAHEWITENARVPLVPAKGTKAKVPTGGLARLRRTRCPDRASCSGYAPTRRPCRDGACSTSCLAPPARAARSGHPSRAQGLARRCAASPQRLRCREATSRMESPAPAPEERLRTGGGWPWTASQGLSRQGRRVRPTPSTGATQGPGPSGPARVWGALSLVPFSGQAEKGTRTGQSAQTRAQSITGAES